MTKLRARVLVIGGGVTGLTAAHECAEAGAEVELIEKSHRWGGKALAYRLSAEEGIEGAPVEHSIRTIQNSYLSLFETMRRIPLGDGVAFDILRPVPQLVLTEAAKSAAPVRLSTALNQPSIRRSMAFYNSLRRFGASRRDAGFWLCAIAFYLLGGRRARAHLASKSFASLIEGRGDALKRFLLSFVDIVFAAKADASAGVVLDLFARIYMAPNANPYQLTHMINVPSGPLNECLIEPWVAHLQSLGVKTRLGTIAAGLERKFEAGEEKAIAARLADGTRVSADAIIMAATPTALATLVPDLFSRSIIPKMRREWSGGFQFFLRELPPGVIEPQSFNMLIFSPWSIIWLLEAPPLWPAESLPNGVAGVLSATVSCFTQPGVVYSKPFHQCSWPEVQEEILAQIGFARRDLIIGAHADPLLARMPLAAFETGRETRYSGWERGPQNSDGEIWASASALWIYGPETGTGGMTVETPCQGLFIGGEFTSTYTKVPTMEKANQAGKLCAAAALEFLKIPYDKSRIRRDPAAASSSAWA